MFDKRPQSLRQQVVRPRGAPEKIIRRAAQRPQKRRVPRRIHTEKKSARPLVDLSVLARFIGGSLLAAGIIGLVIILLPYAFSVFTLLNKPDLKLALPLAQPEARLELPLLDELGLLKIVHGVKKGETLGTIFQSYGLSSTTADLVRKSLRSLKDEAVPTAIRPGQELNLEFSSSGELTALRTLLTKGNELAVIRDPEGAYYVELHTPVKESKEHLALGVIKSSFAAAANKAGMSYDVVDDMVDLFSNRVSFHKDFRKGDRFSLVYHAEVLEDGTQVGAGPILAAALEVDGKTHFAIRYIGSDGKARYFDETGQLKGDTFLRYPLKFSRISSHFSTSRFHPVLKRRRPHNGVDFAAPTGTPVRTVADGVITFAGRKGGAGKMIKIRHSDRYSTAYLHLSRINSSIRKGRKVSRGELIGAVGKTGLATGPHLHFSFYDRGKYVDPLKIKLPTLESLSKGKKIDAAYLKKVLFTLRHYQNVNLDQYYGGRR